MFVANRCELMLSIIVHHGLDAAGLEDASRTARLPAQHEDDRQGRLAFRVGQCRRRQVDEGFACFKLRFRGRNVDFVDGSVRRNIADCAVGGLFAPLCDGDELCGSLAAVRRVRGVRRRIGKGYGQHCDDGERRRRKPASDQAYVHKPLTHISHPQHIGFPST